MPREDKLGPDADTAYAALMQAHEGLSAPDSHAFNARLILLMMNEIGDLDLIQSLLDDAKT